ncbi:MAG: NADH-quinone oxidoreductase subunit NuoF [Candidatus Delongbacteria bacterium]|jgi:NADH-quinone oxidoreductase subunit F|nr:NADH-quinone oxidoreductase subunit NuoF [Candidatus Delongbacteria bacterium]
MSKPKIIVGLGSCGVAAGAGKVYNRLLKIHESDPGLFETGKTSCIGMCYREPLVEITDDKGKCLYGDVDDKKLEEIIESHIKNGQAIEKYAVHSETFSGDEQAFIDEQEKIVLRNCGMMDPESIDEYESRDGYKSIKKLINENISEDQVIETLLSSGLRGRGGGGFPTGLKWKFARGNKSDEKYVICNADEGDPGAFMDRSVLEGDPHSILEGMIIAAYTINATGGVIYCRAEYPLAVKRLNLAISQAHEKGYLGKNILGKEGFNFDIYVKEGAGAFVCGEETALIGSIEGKRGMPDKRPPFPAESGLWNKPTNINNVETFANIPWIILNGAEEYAKHGTEKSKGTKVFALAGKIKNSGLVEVPMGITINEIIFKLGGGIKDGGTFKAVQLGGPSGGCIPASLGTTIVDYDSVNATGAIMGSGGMVVMDETTCMVDVAKFFLNFTQEESCGKCTFCRIGTKRMLEILEKITDGKGEEGDIEKLIELSDQIKDSSLCGLGQTAPNPVLTTIKYFRSEYETHIRDKKCPAKACNALLTYTVNKPNCIGCTACARVCPTKAISGKVKEKHFIDQEACIKCGACFDVCKFKAIDLN